jgi:peptide/nickel transport system substrate-binding protein
MKNTNKYFLGILVIISSFLGSCKESKNDDTTAHLQAKGGKSYGGVFNLSETEYIQTLFPPSIVDRFSYRTATQVYEGLFKFNVNTLEVEKSLADSYTLDSSGTVYTIKLKQGVYFHDNECFADGKGRELVADDIKYCFLQLCSPNALNQNISLLKGIIKGSNNFYQDFAAGKNPNEIEGIKVIDKYTIQFVLEKPNTLFLYNLARAGTMIYPKEAFEKYKEQMRIKAVGTGPFYLANVSEGEAMFFKRHSRYYGKDSLGNQLPFLDGLNLRFINTKVAELSEFRKNNLDMVYRIPTESILQINEEMGKDVKQGEYAGYELQRSPEMLTHCLVFQTKNGIFQNVNLRKAFAYSIDRKKILELVLNGEGNAPGEHGIVPVDVFAKYDAKKVPGYSQRQDSAIFYLKKAGFTKGKDVPRIKMEYINEGGRNAFVAVEIQKQIKDVLNVDIELNPVGLAQSKEAAESGNFQLLWLSWLAYYPSPENFLEQFYGKLIPTDKNGFSFPNISRYNNPEFDRLYEKAINAKTTDDANQYYLQAETVMMKDSPALMLWYDEGYRLVHGYVKNFPNNALQYRDFSQVWLEKKK